jgi:hypothetical protein
MFENKRNLRDDAGECEVGLLLGWLFMKLEDLGKRI